MITVAFVIAKAPYARRSIEIAEHVKARGATVIGVTDELNSPLCAHCDATFFVSTKSPQFFSSHVATLVLIETIMGMVVARSEKEVSLRIAAVERESHQMGEYFSNTLNK